MPEKSIPALLIDEVLNPFYIFQVFSMILWFWDGYIVYAICIFVISVLGIVQNLYDIRSNLANVRRIARFECPLVVNRFGSERNSIQEYNISSVDLVPGDIVQVPNNCTMPCDMVLLQGQCIVNESMLTGESVPVIKNSLDKFSNQIFDPEDSKSKKNILFSGTKVI